jgi:hypothetical protein
MAIIYDPYSFLLIIIDVGVIGLSDDTVKTAISYLKPNITLYCATFGSIVFYFITENRG